MGDASGSRDCREGERGPEDCTGDAEAQLVRGFTTCGNCDRRVEMSKYDSRLARLSVLMAMLTHAPGS